jgi:hypothetical protein
VSSGEVVVIGLVVEVVDGWRVVVVPPIIHDEQAVSMQQISFWPL